MKQLELFTTNSRFLRTGSAFPRNTLNHIGQCQTFCGDSVGQNGIRYKWEQALGFGGGFIEFGFRSVTEVCPAVEPGSSVILSNIKINRIANRLQDGTKEGFLAFITMIATIEQIGISALSRGIDIFHIERATTYSLPMFREQVKLGNYHQIPKAASGFLLDYPGYFIAKYPIMEDSLKGFALKEIVEWGKNHLK